jgi:hypothetical protein
MRKVCVTLLMLGVLVVEGVAQPRPSCKRVTLKGDSCKSTFTVNGYCRVHNPNAIRCNVLTKANKPCRVVVDSVGVKCFNHKAK